MKRMKLDENGKLGGRPRKTTAQKIKDACQNSWSDATYMAAELSVDADQDWENETTVFIFRDKSRLVFCGPDFDVYRQ